MARRPQPGVAGAPAFDDLIRGSLPHRHSAASQIKVYVLTTYPGIFCEGRDVLLAQCGGSPPVYEIVRSLWAMANICTEAVRIAKDDDAKSAAEAEFVDALYHAWRSLKRVVGAQTAIDCDLDLTCGDTTEQDLFDLVTLLLADCGDIEARHEYAEVAWRHARGRKAGEDDLFLAAVGASMHGHDPFQFRRWRAGRGPTGFVSACIEHGRRVILGVNAVSPHPGLTAEVMRPSSLARVEAARKEATDAAVSTGPSMLVLSTVSHLPGSARDGEEKVTTITAANARTEFAPIAGRLLPLVTVPDLARVRRNLVREFPDAVVIIDSILAPLAGRRYAYLSPALLVGLPGSGKTRLARRLGEELGLATTVYSCSGVADGSFLGTTRQYSTGRASVPLQAIRRSGSANALVILDELSRGGTRSDNGRVTDAVLSMIERQTARCYHDPYVEAAVDLSAISFIATSNSVADLDRALRNRFRIYEMPMPTAAALPVLVEGIVAELRVERGLDERWLHDLTPAEVELISDHWSGGSVRTLQRMVEVAVDSRDLGMLN